MTHIGDEQKQKGFIHTPNVPLLHSDDPLVLLDHQSSLDYLPRLRITIPNPPPLNTPPHPASKWDNPTTTLFLPTCNFKALHITLLLLTEATTGYHNATDVNNTGTLNKIATLHYGRSYSVKSASGNELLKTIALTLTCPQSPSRPLEATFLTMKTLKDPENSDYC